MSVVEDHIVAVPGRDSARAEAPGPDVPRPPKVRVVIANYDGATNLGRHVGVGLLPNDLTGDRNGGPAAARNSRIRQASPEMVVIRKARCERAPSD